ncbi:MAG: DNA ligase LigA-related protein, partial [Solirubrobacterales bacterium]
MTDTTDPIPAEIAARVEDLREQLAHHNKLYYEHDNPAITDAQYDALLNELREYEADHPELATPSSPTQKVGGAPASRFPQVEHLQPMLSLANARNDEELRAWELRVRNRLAAEGITGADLEF